MFLKKCFLFSITATLIFAFTPFAFAQDYGSPLESIKAKLEGEDIHVIDYSTPLNEWGALPNNWINFLRNQDYDDLGELAEEFSAEFDEMRGLRNDLALAEATKSQTSNRAEIAQYDSQIEDLNDEITDLEELVKDELAALVSTVSPAQREEGINLLFREMDFYFSYDRWGPLPIRITSILEANENESLRQMIDEYGLNSTDVTTRNEGVQQLVSDLSAMEDLSSDDVEEIIEATIILRAEGERQISQIIRSVVDVIKNLIGFLAVIIIVYSGIRMIFAQGDENTITEQKKGIIYGVIGLVLVLLMDVAVDTLYGVPGEVRQTLDRDTGFSIEIYGLVSFIKAVIGIFAIFFIVLSGIRTIVAQGEEEQITKQRKTLLWIGVGIIALAIDQIIIENFFILPVEQSDQISSTNVATIINTFSSVLKFFLGFVGLIALGALIYGAGLMITNYGNDEMVEKSKKIIRNAIIGIIVIISAYTLVATLVVFR